MRLNMHPVCHALKSGVVEREDVVGQLGEALRAMVGVHTIHPLKSPNPGRVLDSIRAVGPWASIRKRMTRERFVIRRAEEKRVGAVKGYDDNRVLSNVSPETDVAEPQVVVRRRESGHGRPGIAPGDAV